MESISSVDLTKIYMQNLQAQMQQDDAFHSEQKQMRDQETAESQGS